MPQKRKPYGNPGTLPGGAPGNDPEGAKIIAAVQRAFDHLATLGPLVAPKAKSTAPDEFKRGPWIGDVELDAEIKDAWRPLLTDSDMQRLTPEGRATIQLEILQKVARARTERDRRWLGTLEKGDRELVAEWIKRTDRDRQSGAMSRLGGAKGAAARGSAVDKASCLAVVQKLGAPPKNSVATLLKHPHIHHFVTGYTESTVRRWIRTIDGRPKNKRSGRPRTRQ